MNWSNPLDMWGILDGDTIRRPVDMAEIERSMSDNSRRIGQDEIGDAMVSTVFLGLEHFGGMWFETMIFGGDHDQWCGDHDQWCDRYTTLAQARAGHDRVVTALREGRSPESES